MFDLHALVSDVAAQHEQLSRHTAKIYYDGTELAEMPVLRLVPTAPISVDVDEKIFSVSYVVYMRAENDQINPTDTTKIKFIFSDLQEPQKVVKINKIGKNVFKIYLASSTIVGV